MADSFIPLTDAGALAWMQAFSSGISASPSSYMLSSADATAIADAVNAYDSAYTVANNPATRTKSSINFKDQQRAAAEALCRQYAILIKFNAGINDQDKIDIGVRPVNPSREPVLVPGTSPLLSVIASTPGVQTVRFADSTTPTSRAKPFGASELLLWVAVAEQNIADPTQAKFIGKYTKNPVAVAFDFADRGKQATYFARWAGRRGDLGPWSLPASLSIAA